ncbi:MAG: extracellular solute-binding protein [Spirochaetota bacterium]
MKKYLFIYILLFFVSCSHQQGATIIVFHAGSLSALFKECKVEFEKQYNYTVLLEASGSIDAVRKITDLHKPCDVIALADGELFLSMLKAYCPYWISFASNEMVLAYNKTGKFAKALATNWMDALLRYDLTCARSDPLRDPCGYRTLLVWELASRMSNNPNLKKVLALRSPVEYMRSKEIECIALLEAGACDALWIYKSVAVQQNFPYITLSDKINLSNPEYEQLYRKACVTLSDTNKQHRFCGNIINYGVSIPVSAVNTKGAVAFLMYLFSKEGKALIAKYGFSVIELRSNQWDIMPLELKKVVVGGKYK